MSDLKKSIEDAAMKLAKQHAEIIDNNLKMVCEAYGCKPEQLILECKINAEYSVKIDAMNFKIENQFIIRNDVP